MDYNELSGSRSVPTLSGHDLGYHVCSIYQNKNQQFSHIIPFFSAGFKYNHKCIYGRDENTIEEVRAAFRQSDLIPDSVDIDTQLELLSKDETYYKNGPFKVDLMMAMLQETVSTTLASGYDGLRITGEMSWYLDSNVSFDDLLSYEIKCSHFYANNKASGICQYNESTFDPALLKQIILTHPYLIINGTFIENKYFYNIPEMLPPDSPLLTRIDYNQLLEAITED